MIQQGIGDILNREGSLWLRPGWIRFKYMGKATLSDRETNEDKGKNMTGTTVDKPLGLVGTYDTWRDKN